MAVRLAPTIWIVRCACASPLARTQPVAANSSAATSECQRLAPGLDILHFFLSVFMIPTLFSQIPRSGPFLFLVSWQLWSSGISRELVRTFERHAVFLAGRAPAHDDGLHCRVVVLRRHLAGEIVERDPARLVRSRFASLAKHQRQA